MLQQVGTFASLDAVRGALVWRITEEKVVPIWDR
jgi:hypothetical protein